MWSGVGLGSQEASCLHQACSFPVHPLPPHLHGADPPPQSRPHGAGATEGPDQATWLVGDREGLSEEGHGPLGLKVRVEVCRESRRQAQGSAVWAEGEPPRHSPQHQHLRAAAPRSPTGPASWGLLSRPHRHGDRGSERLSGWSSLTWPLRGRAGFAAACCAWASGSAPPEGWPGSRESSPGLGRVRGQGLAVQPCGGSLPLLGPQFPHQ